MAPFQCRIRLRSPLWSAPELPTAQTSSAETSVRLVRVLPCRPPGQGLATCCPLLPSQCSTRVEATPSLWISPTAQPSVAEAASTPTSVAIEDNGSPGGPEPGPGGAALAGPAAIATPSVATPTTATVGNRKKISPSISPLMPRRASLSRLNQDRGADPMPFVDAGLTECNKVCRRPNGDDPPGASWRGAGRRIVVRRERGSSGRLRGLSGSRGEPGGTGSAGRTS